MVLKHETGIGAGDHSRGCLLSTTMVESFLSLRKFFKGALCPTKCYYTVALSPLSSLPRKRGRCKRGIFQFLVAALPRQVLCIVGLSVFTLQCAPVLRGTLTCEGVQVLSDQLTVAKAEEYCRYAVRERKKVEGFWGDTWKEPIRINVSSSYRISRALVPGYFGNRGFMEMPLRRVRDNTGALLHEIVHIYAPNNNRFLAEGLAVYLHTKLGGNPAFPNFVEDLRRSAARSLSRVKSLEALNGVRTPRPLSSVMDEETAYVIAGSFVGFLIEGYGLPSFRNFYETGDYEKIYGKSFVTLETEWRLSIQGK
jgi:hypothetical protein